VRDRSGALRAFVNVCRHRGDDAAGIDGHYYFFAPQEDAVLVESVQRGMAAGVLEHGRLLLPSEELIAVFQQWVSDGLRAR
jgi:Ring hydroxylating alpha subunit (catalytic domain)